MRLIIVFPLLPLPHSNMTKIISNYITPNKSRELILAANGGVDNKKRPYLICPEILRKALDLKWEMNLKFIT